MPSETTRIEELLNENAAFRGEIFARCTANAPNYGVDAKEFEAVLAKITRKFVGSGNTDSLNSSEVSSFLDQLQTDDLYLATACAAGNERAWWEFDQEHRSFMERVARHLAKTDIDAQEVIDSVYGELYGTRIVDGERVSKFSTYSGRGSLRGWLRTVIWHSLVDLHRASHDEVSLDEMTENVGDGAAHANFAVPPAGGESEMVEQIATAQYRTATVTAIASAFSSLADHEKLLLLYYHVENLKLREIARLAAAENSPLRGWFQRRSKTTDGEATGRVHESTIMRWLEKSYSTVLRAFRAELETKHQFSDQEIEICMDMATRDLTERSLFENLRTKPVKTAAEPS